MRIQVSWPSVAIVVAVLVAVCVLAALGETEALRVLLPIIAALLVPAPLRLMPASSSSSSSSDASAPADPPDIGGGGVQ
jgi:hypothetical protein